MVLERIRSGFESLRIGDRLAFREHDGGWWPFLVIEIDGEELLVRTLLKRVKRKDRSEVTFTGARGYIEEDRIRRILPPGPVFEEVEASWE